MTNILCLRGTENYNCFWPFTLYLQFHLFVRKLNTCICLFLITKSYSNYFCCPRLSEKSFCTFLRNFLKLLLQRSLYNRTVYYSDSLLSRIAYCMINCSVFICVYQWASLTRSSKAFRMKKELEILYDKNSCLYTLYTITYIWIKKTEIKEEKKIPEHKNQRKYHDIFLCI